MDGSIIIFGRVISNYILLAFSGFWAGIIFGVTICKKRNISRNFIFRMVAGILSIGLFAEIFVTQIPDFMLPFSYISGLLLVCLLGLIISLIFKKKKDDCIEICLLSVNTFMIFSKLGCFFAGCCHGNPYNGFLSVTYSQNSHAVLRGIPLFPIQLIEALVRLLVLVLMLIIYNKNLFGKYRIPIYLCFMSLCYFWGMFFWYEPLKLVNILGIDFIYIFTLIFIILSVFILLIHSIGKISKRSGILSIKKEQ